MSLMCLYVSECGNFNNNYSHCLVKVRGRQLENGNGITIFFGNAIKWNSPVGNWKNLEKNRKNLARRLKKRCHCL